MVADFRSHGNQGRGVDFDSHCPICDQIRRFSAADDYYSCRDSLRSVECPLGNCVTRERAIAQVLFSLYPRASIASLTIHEAAPTTRGMALWLRQNCPGYTATGYFPQVPFGTMQGKLRNEDLENQTFADGSFDVVVHLDVMEHLFQPFQALREICRTLKPGGRCIFTAPTYPDLVKSRQVAWLREDGSLHVDGKPEYHGNPQRPEDGALVTWRYGYDLPVLIARETSFDVEVRRWQAKDEAIMGYMTEVYVLTKPGIAAGRFRDSEEIGESASKGLWGNLKNLFKGP